MPARAADTTPSFEPLGEATLLVRFGSRIDASLNARVHATVAALRAAALPGIDDIAPAYASLALHYRPAVWEDGGMYPWRNLADAVGAVLAHAPAPASASAHARTVVVPVRYGGDSGPDLEPLAARLGLSAQGLVERHAHGEYRVAMLGFAPGFPYLLGLDPALHAPRLANPRLRVPRGSVAIGGAQTGIYPSELPGGWQLIGRTPLALFDATREPACLLAAGDTVHFRAIDDVEFAALERAPQ
jgi:KipI family sensor histidine kinase inhibitor